MLTRKELKTLYAQQAIILHELKRNNEAEAAYRKWQATAPEYTADDYIIGPYLANSGRLNEAIKVYGNHEQQLRLRGDTISYHMRSLLRSLGLVYYRTGKYQKSAEYFLRLAEVTDSLKTREQASSAQELATAYETHKKEAELVERANSIKVRNAWLVGTAAALILLLVLMWRQMRYARLIKKKNSALVENIQELNLDELCGGKTSVGTGGMYSKLLSARRSAQLGVPTLIIPGKEPDIILRAFAGEKIGTWICPTSDPVSRRKYWLAYQSDAQGIIAVDEGAYIALNENGKSLLPGGITRVEGNFGAGALVAVMHQNKKIAVGLSNYSAADLRKIQGLSRIEVAAVLGNAHYPEVIHRDNLLLHAAI